MLAALKKHPAARTIYWLFDEKGGNGKSKFVQYCLSHFGAKNCTLFTLECGRDIKHLYQK